MKIIDTKLMCNNLSTVKRITEEKAGYTLYFSFKCNSNKAILRIKKDNEIIGEVLSGEYSTDFYSSSKELLKTDSKGQWEFVVYLLESLDETKVEVEILDNQLPNYIFYGDLHSHSICSDDAVNTFEEIENKVLSIGNNFHAITDHNSYSMNFQYKNKKSNIEFIYGIEMTNDYGHYNFLGKEIPVDTCTIYNEENLIDKILSHKKNGGYVTFNHPFSPKSRICTLPIIKEYCDFVEIWNGPWATHNKIALKWWHKQLLENIYFPICGGSDTHNILDYKNYGNPVNCIIAPINIQNILLSQLKNGHSYLLSSPKIIEIEFYDVIFGDTIDKNLFKLKFNSNKNFKINIVSNLDNKEYFINDLPEVFDMKNYSFLRFEAYDEDECIFISNPIFSKKFHSPIK